MVEYAAVHILELDLPDTLDEETAVAEAKSQYTKRQLNSEGKLFRFPLRIYFPKEAASAVA